MNCCYQPSTAETIIDSQHSTVLLYYSNLGLHCFELKKQQKTYTQYEVVFGHCG